MVKRYESPGLDITFEFNDVGSRFAHIWVKDGNPFKSKILRDLIPFGTYLTLAPELKKLRTYLEKKCGFHYIGEAKTNSRTELHSVFIKNG